MEKCRLATSKRGTEHGNAIRVRSGLKNQTALLAYNNSPAQSENTVEKCGSASANVSASASAIASACGSTTTVNCKGSDKRGKRKHLKIPGCGGWVVPDCNGGCLNIYKVLKDSYHAEVFWNYQNKH